MRDRISLDQLLIKRHHKSILVPFCPFTPHFNPGTCCSWPKVQKVHELMNRTTTTIKKG